MAKKYFSKALLLLTLVLTGCGGESSSESSETSNSTSQPTTAELFLAAGYIQIRGWPDAVIQNLLTKEDVDSVWASTYIPKQTLPNSNTVLYQRYYENDLELLTYKTYEFALPSTDETIVKNYIDLVNKDEFDVTYDDETIVGNAVTKDDDKVAINVYFSEESEFLPASVNFIYTVRQKEEFVGAPKAPAGSLSRSISFNNDYKIISRDQDKYIWSQLDFNFQVEKHISDTAVGSLPNNEGIGYLINPLRVYAGQKITFSFTNNPFIEIIIRVSETGIGAPASLSALTGAEYEVRNFTNYTSTNSILFYFDDTATNEFSFVLNADARFTEVVGVYAPNVD